MANPAGNGVVAYGELDEKARPAANGPPVTEVQLSRCPEGDLHYSWLEDYLAWLEDKEEHQVYYAWLKQAAPGGNGACVSVQEPSWTSALLLPAARSLPTRG